MPANPWMVKEVEDEGVKFEFLITPKRIIGKKGQVNAIQCLRNELGELDQSGRRKPIPIEGSEFTIKLDTLIIAIGEESDLSFFPKEVETTRNKTVTVFPFTMETTKDGVFAGGDVVSGPASVIEAIVAGKRAAENIDNYLKTKMKSKRDKRIVKVIR